MIAGPNGAGKTTAALKLLPELKAENFVNADRIAYGLNPFNPRGQDITASKIMLRLIKTLTNTYQDFAFETTGASKPSVVRILKKCKAAGYRLNLFFLWLPSIEIACERVRQRTLQGGHNIAQDEISHRYWRGLKNLFETYLPMVQRAIVLDASLPFNPINPQVIARKSDIGLMFNAKIWPDIQKTVERIN